jgi:hypothetical protein
MCLIKTAIISGAAIYGVNKFAKTAQTHQSKTGYTPPLLGRRSDDRRNVDYFDHKTEGYRDHPRSQIQGHRPCGYEYYASQDSKESLSCNDSADPYNSPPQPYPQYLQRGSTDHPNIDNSEPQGQGLRQYHYVPLGPSAPPSYDRYPSSQRYFSET